jgi:hypothetical protein
LADSESDLVVVGLDGQLEATQSVEQLSQAVRPFPDREWKEEILDRLARAWLAPA